MNAGKKVRKWEPRVNTTDLLMSDSLERTILDFSSIDLSHNTFVLF